MNLNRRIAMLILLLLAFSLALVAAWPEETLEAQAPADDGSWRAIGPEGGNIFFLAVSPAFDADGTVFAGTLGSGVFRSTDRGDTWEQVNHGLTSLFVQPLELSPAFATDGTLFAGTLGGEA